MDERQIRIAVVLVAVLAIFVLLRVAWEPPEDVIDPDATAPVWTIEADDIVRVEADYAAGRLAFEKRDGVWVLREPIEDRADQRQVGYLLDELERVENGVPIPDVDPLEFGLGDTPTVRITATLADGTSQTLDVGAEAPVGWRTYVRAADGSVAAVAGIIGQRFQMDPQDLRDTHLLEFGVSTVRRVVIEGPEGTLDVHGEGARWWVEGWTRADNDAVDDLITGIREIRVDEFVSDPAPFGLEAPIFRVTVETTAGPHGLEVGDVSSEGVLVRSLDGRAGNIAPEKLALLGQGPTDVGDAHAFPLSVDEDDAVEVALAGGSWRAVRGAEGWTIEGVDGSIAEEAVVTVAAIPIRYRREPGPALTEAWGTVTVSRGEVRRVVDVGQVVEEAYRVAKDRDGGSPYLVPADVLEAAAKLPGPTP